MIRRRFAALFFVGLAFFSPPIMPIFNRPERIGDIPLLVAYVFSAWALLVIAGAWLGRGGSES